MDRLRNKTAVVTGSARGMGLGIVQRLLAEGAAVLMVDVLADVLPEAAASLAAPGRVETLAVELTAPEAGTRIRAAAEAAFGRVDILVNNAGIGMSGTVEEFTDPEWDRIMAVNVTAPFRLAREMVPPMAARGWGRVVNISSFAATAGQRTDTAYAVSKAGLEALTRSIAVDYGQAGVTCNTIAPGVIVTPLSRAALAGLDPRMPLVAVTGSHKPVPGQGEPADIAAAVAFLASDDARFVTGHVLPVDGGASTVRFVPAPLGMVIARFKE